MISISLILFAVAAAINALMDTLEHHFSTSIFRKLDQRFWNPLVSWKFVRRIFGYPIDAWHLLKSSMIILIVMAITFHGQIIIYELFNMSFFVEIFVYGVVWNLVFNIFYTWIFKIKTKNG